MQKKFKISVIIPAYNAEKYLSEALDSVVFQTMHDSDYEIIIVNDGSTDHTSDILHSYQKKYPNIIVCNKENGGPSSARNAGLDMARGEYIYFFDADDVLINDTLSALFSCAKEHHSDLIIGNYDVLNLYKIAPVHSLDDLICLDEIDKYNPDILKTFALWNKLFRRDLIEEHHLRFEPVAYSEDGIFVMKYLFYSTRITGLNKLLIHYRRFDDINGGSITATVSPQKIKDYITAHQIILACAKESFLKDYPEYDSIEEAEQKNPEIHNYLNKIIQKELLVLLKRFYAKLWTLEQPTIEFLVRQINDRLKVLDLKDFSELSSTLPELPVYSLSTFPEKVLESAIFTAVLYGNTDNEEDFLSCLQSLLKQNIVFIKIVVPSSMKDTIVNQQLLQKNIVFTDCVSEQDLFTKALNSANSPYITFCDAKTVYSIGAFRQINNLFNKNYVDFIAEALNHRDYGELQPLIYSRIVRDYLNADNCNTLCLAMENTLSNKFFSVPFLSKLSINFDLNTADILDKCYHTGHYLYKFDKILIYNDTESSFLPYTADKKVLPLLQKYFQAKPVSLNAHELKYQPIASGAKFRAIPEADAQEAWVLEIPKLKKKKLQNKVAFVSIRSDGELEGNARALYPYINGEKVICAHRLPHDNEAAFEMAKTVLTSKVIVTDDYIKYLRYFPLRPEQKVIQLWHGCGAFKKFGQRGTNLPVATDLSTHSQYNLVCVSSEKVRAIYADAFDINYEKVRALGAPRTDIYFDKKLISKKKREIYSKHPKLFFKSVIVYAPTFRDTEGDRSEFHPELDFDLLSKSLRRNQLLLICPHPLMEAPILPKEYPNIWEMRDFSTNDYMLISDMLITDYSSVIFEYALLRKPIAFFCYDLLRYDRDFYLKYPEDLPGDIFKNQEELTEFLRRKKKRALPDKYNSFVEKYMSNCDGHSCERIAQIINSYMEEN